MQYDSTFYSADTQSFILSRAERNRARIATSATTARRSSKPVKQSQSTVATSINFATTSPAKVFYLGRKSDFIASCSPSTPPKFVTINGVPHKRKEGKYVALKLQSSTEPLVSTEPFVADMYQMLLLVSEGSVSEVSVFEQLLSLARI